MPILNYQEASTRGSINRGPPRTNSPPPYKSIGLELGSVARPNVEFHVSFSIAGAFLLRLDSMSFYMTSFRNAGFDFPFDFALLELNFCLIEYCDCFCRLVYSRGVEFQFDLALLCLSFQVTWNLGFPFQLVLQGVSSRLMWHLHS